MSCINSQRTYQLDDAYEGVKEHANRVLAKYRKYENLVTFSDQAKSVTFTSERLIPAVSTNRPRVMLLFSNPHPHSVKQGMFLSPNTKGVENQFWPVMEQAGWLPIKKCERTPEKLRDLCIQAAYPGPFELIFYCYYAFPTDYPEDIRKIFGKSYFNQYIEPEARTEFKETIQHTSTEAVLTFNKGVFNLVSTDPVERYIARLKEGGLIQSQVKGIDRPIPIFLTYPTGWFFHKEYRKLRKTSLDTIKTVIQVDTAAPENTSRDF